MKNPSLAILCECSPSKWRMIGLSTTEAPFVEAMSRGRTTVGVIDESDGS